MRDSNTFRSPGILPRLLGALLVSITGICLVNSLWALDPNKSISQYIHDSWGADRGFLGGAVYAISQSADGYLWIGTERGLVRFDGFNFTLVQRPLPDSPPVGPVRGLVADAEGNLWIRPEGPHFLLYRDGKFEDAFARFKLDEIILTATSGASDDGMLLTGLSNHTLRYHNGSFEAVAAEEVPGTVISLAETRDRAVWLGTRDNGLFRMYNGHASNVSGELKDMKINVLLPASNGGLWIGTDHGILFWNNGGLVPTGLPSSINELQILAMIKDHDGNVWVGTDHGLIRITPAGIASLDELNPDRGHEVTAIYEDHDGQIWFGGGHGIERLRDGLFTTYATTQGLPSDSNGPLYVDSEGRTWFAPSAGGLYWLKDGHIGRITVAGLSDDVVYSISGGQGEIWIGRQRGGLTVLTPTNDSFAAQTFTTADGLAQNSVYCVHRNRDGSVWAGTISGGLSKLKNGVFTNYSVGNGLTSNTVNSILEDQNGKMWFATPNGLASFDRGHWTNLSVRDGLPSSNVTSIFQDSTNVLWIATSGGLAFLSSGRIKVPRNLPEPLREQIVGITEDKHGSLWIATSDHVLRVNRDRLIDGSLQESDVQSYGIDDGLLGVEGVNRERSVLTDSLGRMWISLNRGISVVDPASMVSSNSRPVDVRIESMSANGNQIPLRDRVNVAAGSQNIAFKFAGTSLSIPERTRFRYKLDGFDRAWSDVVALRQVVYTNLGPGSYRFRVVASNGAGLWNGPETTISFDIERAFWQTWWFRLSMLGVLVLLGAAIYRLRIRQITKRLNTRFQERLAERTRIAQELHDTLLQGFLSASMQLDVAEDQLPDDSPTKPQLKRVLQLMGQVTEEGRNALQGLRTKETDQRNLELAFSRVREELGMDDRVAYRVISDSVTRPVRPVIRDEVYRIGREALVNAFLHAQAKTVEVEVEYANRYLRVMVRDDGCGIDPHVLQSGRAGHWGLAGMRERSESMGGSLRLRSRIGAGTEVELTVPSVIAFEGQSSVLKPRWLSWLKRERYKATGGK